MMEDRLNRIRVLDRIIGLSILSTGVSSAMYAFSVLSTDPITSAKIELLDAIVRVTVASWGVWQMIASAGVVMLGLYWMAVGIPQDRKGR